MNLKMITTLLTLGLAGLALATPSALAVGGLPDSDQKVFEGQIVDAGPTPSWCVYYWYSIGDWTIYVGAHHVYIAEVAKGSGQVCPLGPTLPIDEIHLA